MAYVDQAILANDTAFRSRVKVAIVTAALVIGGEAKGAQSESKYRKRQGLAYSILVDPNSHLDRFSFSATADPLVIAASLDAVLQTRVESLWNDLAGVNALD